MRNIEYLASSLSSTEQNHPTLVSSSKHIYPYIEFQPFWNNLSTISAAKFKSLAASKEMPNYSDAKPVLAPKSKRNSPRNATSYREKAGNTASGEENTEIKYTLLARQWGTSYDSTTHMFQSESREVANQDATPMERWSQERLHDAPWNGVAGYSTTTTAAESSRTWDSERKEEQQGSWSVKGQDGSAYEQLWLDKHWREAKLPEDDRVVAELEKRSRCLLMVLFADRSRSLGWKVKDAETWGIGKARSSCENN
jgi:hypothetical protein